MDILDKYSKLNFIKSTLKSPINNGSFTIFINTEHLVVYKKIITKIDDIITYKRIIYGVKNNEVLNRYICQPDDIYIEDDGSYYSTYIKNGLRLYDININTNIDVDILPGLKQSILDMKNKLNNYVIRNKLIGDWALHNLIYCLDTNKIYNIDLEGFYTYPLIHDNGNCDIKFCT